MKFLKLATVLLVVMATALLALAHVGNADAATTHAASAPLHQIIAGGIPSHNATKATSMVMQTASYDPDLAKHIAEETGASTFVESDMVAAGYQNGAPGTVNAGVSSSGVVVATGDTPECNIHSRMLRIMNKTTGQVVLFCTACGNIRLHVHHPVRFHRFVKKQVLRFRWSAHVVKTTTCPATNQAVTVTVDVVVKGIVRVKTWAKAVRVVKQKISIAISKKITIKVGITCSQPPPPPPKTPRVKIAKDCEADTGDLETCPTGTFSFQVTTGGSTRTVVLNSNPQDAGTCKVGDSVKITENSLSGWEILSANPQTFTCTTAGITAVFKNRQTPPPPPPPAPKCWFNAIQEVDASNYPNISTAPVTLNCVAPAGDELSITLHTIYGTLSTTTLSLTATGDTPATVTVTYTAPTEAVNDMVTANVVDETTGLVANPDPSTPIKVVDPDPNP